MLSILWPPFVYTFLLPRNKLAKEQMVVWVFVTNNYTLEERIFFVYSVKVSECESLCEEKIWLAASHEWYFFAFSTVRKWFGVTHGQHLLFAS